MSKEHVDLAVIVGRAIIIAMEEKDAVIQRNVNHIAHQIRVDLKRRVEEFVDKLRVEHSALAIVRIKLAFGQTALVVAEIKIFL